MLIYFNSKFDLSAKVINFVVRKFIWGGVSVLLVWNRLLRHCVPPCLHWLLHAVGQGRVVRWIDCLKGDAPKQRSIRSGRHRGLASRGSWRWWDRVSFFGSRPLSCEIRFEQHNLLLLGNPIYKTVSQKHFAIMSFQVFFSFGCILLVQTSFKVN